MNIPFNKVYLTGTEIEHISTSLSSRHIAGNGTFTKRCETFFKEKLVAKKTLLTTSCTDALEMCALLCDIKAGDEVIIPSFTFVSTAIAFIRCGAKIIFADSSNESPCIDASKLEALITSKTKAIVVVHYAGIACDMDAVISIANKHNLLVIEDAAQAIDSYYKGKPLGSFGHLACFSFHETKNIHCGEGGLLVINDERFCKRAEIIWEKGTNRAEFFRGEVNKYGWKDIGSSFLPADYVSAFLWSQLEKIELIQTRRKAIWQTYYNALADLDNIRIQQIPDYATNNAHIFYILCSSGEERGNLIKFMKESGVHATFHYLSLHKSVYIQEHQPDAFHSVLPYADYYTDCLLRLPIYVDMSMDEVNYVIEIIQDFYKLAKVPSYDISSCK